MMRHQKKGKIPSYAPTETLNVSRNEMNELLKHFHSNMKSKQSTIRKQFEQEYQQKFAALKEQHKTEMEALKKKNALELRQLKQKCDQCEQELKRLKQELKSVGDGARGVFQEMKEFDTNLAQCLEWLAQQSVTEMEVETTEETIQKLFNSIDIPSVPPLREFKFE